MRIVNLRHIRSTKTFEKSIFIKKCSFKGLKILTFDKNLSN